MAAASKTFQLITPLPEEVSARVNGLADQDLFGQWIERRGPAAELARESGDVKLDWVDGVEKAMESPDQIAAAEQEAASLLHQGIRRILWAGMGGSVQTVYALRRLGLLGSQALSFHPLDSTDPASLNRILREAASLEGIDLTRPDALRTLLSVTAMIGVSMGMTSEEPITHLEWFDSLLQAHRVTPASGHIEVMTLPGSYLDQFARPRGCPARPIQLDGQNHTGGRFSAPATRVFIRPAALTLAVRGSAGFSVPACRLLRPLLEGIQALHPVHRNAPAAERRLAVRQDPFIQLAAAIDGHVRAGRNQVFLATPRAWRGIEPWVEQLVEESLGKGGRGFLIFSVEAAGAGPLPGMESPLLVIALETPSETPDGLERLAAEHPVLRLRIPEPSLEASGALFLGWERLVAAYACLADITFAGQPAVEAYKKYARDLRLSANPVPWPEASPHQARFGCWTLYFDSVADRAPLAVQAARSGGDAAAVYAAVLHEAVQAFAGQRRTPYLDFTFNGEILPALRDTLEGARARIAHRCLGLEAKLRCGPADYHSTEQAQTDGPPELVSLRLVALRHEAPLAGFYSDKFLLAQARGTWQAMEDAGRWILLMTTPVLNADALQDLNRFFAETPVRLTSCHPRRN